MRIFLLGYPGYMGGANTECWHTVKLWRKAGWDVTLIPTWGQDPSMRAKLDATGVETVEVERVKICEPASMRRPTLQEVPGLPGSIVVAMCNSKATSVFDELRAIGCKIVWVNCMTFIDEPEHRCLIDHGPADAYVFQSEFQRGLLEPRYRRYGYDEEQGFLVRGAFDFDDFPFRPRAHTTTGEFVVGKLARPDADKWATNHWAVLGGIPHQERRALCMGWTKVTEQKCGKPPSWAECLPPQGVSAQKFLSRCHCLLQINGGAKENWPRVGLEAMAAGVPIIAPNKWGWRAMINHGHTGFLSDTDAEAAYYAARLAYDEPFRLQIAHDAFTAARELADEERLIAAWATVFGYCRSRGLYVKPELRI